MNGSEASKQMLVGDNDKMRNVACLDYIFTHSLLEVFRVCLVFPPLVSVYGSFHVIMSSFVPGVCNL